LLERNGIVRENPQKARPITMICPRCNNVHALESNYCTKCSYPLTSEAFNEIKAGEAKAIEVLKQDYKSR